MKRDCLKPTPKPSTTPHLLIENRIGTYLSVKDLSLRLNIPQKTIYGWIHRGVIKPEKIGPRLLRFSEKYIEQWIANFRGE